MTPTEPQTRPVSWRPASWISLILLVIAVVIFVLLAIKTIDKPNDVATAFYWALASFAASFFPWPL